MKRLTLLVLVLCAFVSGRANAQDTNVITLDQTNPSAQISITMPPNTTGVVSINVSKASIEITDANNNIVFSSADPRVHLVELSIAPNTGAHTLTAQRLPGVDAAALHVSSQPDLTPTSTSSLVDVSTLGFQQVQTLPLTTTNPGGNAIMRVPQDTTGVLTAIFTGTTAAAEVVDAAGTVVASSSRDIDGFNLVLDGGNYRFSLLANQLDHPVTANVQVMPANQFSLLAAPQAPAQAAAIQPCTAVITTSSVNLRSGPGRGYTVLNYGYLGDTFTVGGVNPDNSWLVVGGNQGSAWLSSSLAQLSGDCTNLKVFSVPYRNPQPAQIIIQPAPDTNFNIAPGSVANPPASPPISSQHGDGGGSEGEGD